MIEPNLVENKNYGNILKILHLVVFISYNILVINGIRKIKITKLQKEKNKKNVMNFWLNILKELIVVPITLFLYWILLVFSMRIITTFIIMITNSEQSEEKKANTISNFVSNISGLLLNNLETDFRIFLVLFVLNAIIIIFLLIILLFNVNNNIDSEYINRVFTLYQVILTISLIYLFDLFNK